MVNLFVNVSKKNKKIYHHSFLFVQIYTVYFYFGLNCVAL
jgi:hypothetical protein